MYRRVPVSVFSQGLRFFRTMTPQDVASLRKSNKCVLLDVRETNEYKAGALTGQDVHSSPLSLWKNKLTERDLHQILPVPYHNKTQTVVCYCRSGKRSANAATILESHGWNDVVNMEGGLLKWSAEVDPTIKVL
eukprot:TRINITY_DN28657_c0_g1_i2.p1 TRINITY_DN28657_c0_g1~~TRINITY_DN28657_c0_g1_i2.p1  ORF type:complete len:134 (-),score=5.95 TRINITY_DN28657_c0_g1_i2:77-478(-)